MPAMFPTHLSQAGVRAACLVLNHLLAQQPALQSRLASVQGKTLGLAIGRFSGVLGIDAAGCLVPENTNSAKEYRPDTRITLPWSVVLDNLANPAAMRRAVQLQGDVDFAQTVVAVLSALRWDAELDLARLVGEVPAVWAMRAFKAAGLNARQAFEGTVNALREYLVYERGLLPRPAELDGFRERLEALRDHVARLEKRVDQLHHNQNRG